MQIVEVIVVLDRCVGAVGTVAMRVVGVNLGSPELIDDGLVAAETAPIARL